jgi:DNA polymerase-3 subunit delta
MQILPDRLDPHLASTLAPVYLVQGDEPLVIEEACDRIRAAARERGFADRTVFNVEGRFDWEQVKASAGALSLFSTQRLIELRMPTGRPGEAGARLLCEFADDPPADTLLLVITGRLESGARASKWAKSLERAGVGVTARAVDAGVLPEWIEQRLRRRGLSAEPEAVALLAHFLEGNLLAIAQEIDKLALNLDARRVTRGDVEASIADNARFTVFALVDACLAGHSARAVRMLGGLRAEGVEPVLVVWALGREVRAMAQIAAQARASGSVERALAARRVWSNRQGVVKTALRRFGLQQWWAAVSAVARLDRVLKGRARGDIWHELECFALRLSGVPLPAPERRGTGVY